MRTYIARRLLLMVPVVLLITFAVAGLMRMVPGDPATLALGQTATEADRERFREAYHLDDPLPVQYLRWWGDVLQGDLGHSVVQRTTVTSELARRLPATLELVVLSVLLTLAIGVPLGVFCAVRHNTALDYVLRVVTAGGLAIPAFWLGTLLLLLPGIWWGYLPPIGRVSLFDDPLRNLEQFLLPSLTLAVGGSAIVVRLTRSSVLETLRHDYIRAAYARGLRERHVLMRHALRNALIPVVTVLGLQVAALMGGSVIIEQVFNLQGVGLFLVSSIVARDYPAIQGVVLFLAVLFLLLNLAVDLSYSLLDPRIRYR